MKEVLQKVLDKVIGGYMEYRAPIVANFEDGIDQATAQSGCRNATGYMTAHPEITYQDFANMMRLSFWCIHISKWNRGFTG